MGKIERGEKEKLAPDRHNTPTPGGILRIFLSAVPITPSYHVAGAAVHAAALFGANAQLASSSMRRFAESSRRSEWPL